MYTLDNFIKDIREINNIDEIELELKLLLDKQYQKGKLIDIGYTNEELKNLFKSLFDLLDERYHFVQHQFVNIISQNVASVAL